MGKTEYEIPYKTYTLMKMKKVQEILKTKYTKYQNTQSWCGGRKLPIRHYPNSWSKTPTHFDKNSGVSFHYKKKSKRNVYDPFLIPILSTINQISQRMTILEKPLENGHFLTKQNTIKYHKTPERLQKCHQSSHISPSKFYLCRLSPPPTPSDEKNTDSSK